VSRTTHSIRGTCEHGEPFSATFVNETEKNRDGAIVTYEVESTYEGCDLCTPNLRERHERDLRHRWDGHLP